MSTESENRLRGLRSLRDVYWSLREKDAEGASTPHEVGASRVGGFGSVL